ncbi:CBS domain-containing protein [Caenorhabditis elegans]|uniref:CBS domain-containing protein n=1 Tax=Caenorhabditis elegans TaxID=6239 RepID=Q22022_CAEEL|nr:CBS domain-containing protein [Caenorhabditis elegans]CAA91351.1 CBS domain-containing protein [Caenorhabditis elegans]|eukprot:NP_496155.1 AMP-Activated protein Kinase Gamma subunit [Caenorhabditis elegans]
MNRLTMLEKGCDPIAGGSPKNSYTKSPKPDTPASEQRRNSTSGRRPSFLSQVRDLIHPRTGSLGASMFRRPEATRRVQVAECNVEAVYDLRDKHAHFYDDDNGFRRPRSNSSDLLILRKTSRPISFNVVGVIDQKTDPYHQYMSVVDVYELCPNNSKVIIIDASTPTTRAFRIMRDHNITTLIVWDTSDARHVKRNILTLTDCLNAIRNETPPADGQVLRASDILSGNQLVSVSISSKILDLCEELHQNRLHRVVVLDDAKEVVNIISVRRVIAAIHKQNRSLHFAQWLSKSIGMSAIGTWENVAVISQNETVYRAMEDMLGFHYSALPVVDSKQNVIGVITKTDICKALPRNFIEPKRWLQETKVSDILHICKSQILISSADSVGQVLDTLLAGDTQSAFAIHNGKAIGVISLTDFLSHILRSPLATTDEEPSQEPAMPPTPESNSSSTENVCSKLKNL